MTFHECILACARNQEFVKEYDRLEGSNLSRRGAPIELMVDDSSGRTEAELAKFIAFIERVVWVPLCSESGT